MKLPARVDRSYTKDISQYIDNNNIKFLIIDIHDRYANKTTSHIVCEKFILRGHIYIFVDKTEVKAYQLFKFPEHKTDSEFLHIFNFKSPTAYADHLTRELAHFSERYIDELLYLISTDRTKSDNFKNYKDRIESMINQINLMNNLRGSPKKLEFLSLLRDYALKKHNKKANHLVEKNRRYLLEYKQLEDPQCGLDKLWSKENTCSNVLEIFLNDPMYRFLFVSHPNINIKLFRQLCVAEPYYAFNNPVIAMLNLENTDPLITQALQIYTKEY